MSTPTRRPAIVGRGQRPQTNNIIRVGDYQDSEYYDREDDGSDDASMLAEAPTLDLRAIMASIKALASTAASLQLASQRPQKGGPRRAQGQQQAPVCTYPPGAIPPTQPTLEDLGRQT